MPKGKRKTIDRAVVQGSLTSAMRRAAEMSKNGITPEARRVGAEMYNVLLNVVRETGCTIEVTLY